MRGGGIRPFVHAHFSRERKRKMKVTVCIGSSCHLKGSREIVEKFQQLITENDLKDKVDLSGKFCLGNCTNGVSVTVDGELFSVSPDTADAFFKNNIIGKLS